MARRAFTLIELLVVIAIITILAGLLFPVFARARHAPIQLGCTLNLRALGHAFTMYTEDHDLGYPSHDAFAGGGCGEERIGTLVADWENSPQHNWSRALLPYLGDTQRYVCPASLDPKTPLPSTPTSYVLNGRLTATQPAPADNHDRYVVFYDYRVRMPGSSSNPLFERVGEGLGHGGGSYCVSGGWAAHPDYRQNVLYLDGHLARLKSHDLHQALPFDPFPSTHPH